RVEGRPVSHGVVVAGDSRGVAPFEPPVMYPGLLPSRKRTPLLFDGSESVLVVKADGRALTGVDRQSIPGCTPEAFVRSFESVLGIDGALTAAASKGFHGVGAYLRADQTIWI